MKHTVLFLCQGNSARSQMAEAVLKKQASNYFEVFSAGTSPQNLDPKAIDSIEQFGLSTAELYSKPLSQFSDRSFDFVITLCDKANQECKTFPNAKETIAWNFEDPKSRAGINPYDTTLRELNERMKMFVLVQTKQQRDND